MVHLTVGLTRKDGPDPPYDHNFLLGSAVLSLLRDHSPEASQAIHDSPHRTAYVLSEIHRVTGKAKEAWFRVGTSHERVANIVGKALVPGTELRINATTFRIADLAIEEPTVRPGEYVTLSPILLRDKETGQHLVHDSPGYVERLQAAANHQVKQYLKKEGTIRVLRFEPQAVRKRTIKGRTVLAQKGRMLLDGPEDELRLMVDHGIGMSPALGFGMVVGNDGHEWGSSG